MLIRCRRLSFGSESQIRCKTHFGMNTHIHAVTTPAHKLSLSFSRTHTLKPSIPAYTLSTNSSRIHFENHQFQHIIFQQILAEHTHWKQSISAYNLSTNSSRTHTLKPSIPAYNLSINCSRTHTCMLANPIVKANPLPWFVLYILFIFLCKMFWELASFRFCFLVLLVNFSFLHN
jgi:hypothetical protein